MEPDDLIDAWEVNNAMNLKMLAHCTDEMMEFKPGKGKTIRSNFVHIIGIRRAYLEAKSKAEAEKIAKLDWQTASREQIAEQLNLSSDLTAEFLLRLCEKPQAGKWHPVRFLAGSLMHESNHRAQIELAWRLNGVEPTNQFLYSLWEWKK